MTHTKKKDNPSFGNEKIQIDQTKQTTQED